VAGSPRFAIAASRSPSSKREEGGMYLEEQAANNIRACCNRIDALITQIEQKVDIEMINVWAKRDTKKALQEIRKESYNVLLHLGDY
jgi:aspartate/glutamate racemase